MIEGNIDRFLKSFEDLGVNYREYPERAEFGDNHIWITKSGDSWNKPLVDQYYTGQTYVHEDQDRLLMKTAAVVIGGRYFFSLATIYQSIDTFKHWAEATCDVWTRFKKESSGKTFKEFFQEQPDEVWVKPVEKFTDCLRTYGFLIPFQFVPFDPLSLVGINCFQGLSAGSDAGNVISVAWCLFAVYCVYHPQYPRVSLTKAERWLMKTPESSVDLSKKTTFQKVREVFRGNVLPSELLGWKDLNRCPHLQTVKRTSLVEVEEDHKEGSQKTRKSDKFE